tara:strand:- start:381 stop:1043 length:663 start_codon:yes stop_codon:yes gene_type:complete
MNPETDFSIRPFLGGLDNNFTYLISCSRTGVQVIIDASVKLNAIAEFVKYYPTAILITHSHRDHIYYLEDYLKAYPKMVILGHPKSEIFSEQDNFQGLENDQSFHCGELKFKCMHTPGHYYDSVCYLLKPALFTGDTMFVGRTGRVVSNRSNIKDLYESIYNKILIMAGNTRIYPGHDYGEKPSVLLEENIKASPLLKAKDLNDFKKRMDNYEKNRKPGS